MKASQVLAVLAITASASAAPWKNNKWGNWRGGWKNQKCADGPFDFTSTYSVIATPDQVVDQSGNFTGGLPGTVGYYDYGINSRENYICWNIELQGFRGEYQSAANTATHIHEAPRGQAGPPRLAIPNPVPVGDGQKRISIGCMMGPFETGIISNGQDTGAGFEVRQIEQNPAGFFTDVHSSLAVPGAVRAQLG
ncbi:hypothetical protein B0A50_01989 [Salinomyces thailandicus]|uniref:CHRD domain-containing protein n=1 Tax=Salinomyces thailandicus TaxID=706561 RepID=A0A4U0U719_9PEZI|nr:hypothetical protein B0A50_01989 [Salinomyces thailandica]